MNIHDAYNQVESSLHMALSAGKQTMHLLPDSHKDIAVNELNSYMQHAAMNAHFADSAYGEGNHKEASQHLENLQESMRALHQAAKDKMGPHSALTQAYNVTMPGFHKAVDTYREVAGGRLASLGKDFEGIMKHSNINPKQFD